jgi:hypothetical protein
MTGLPIADSNPCCRRDKPTQVSVLFERKSLILALPRHATFGDLARYVCAAQRRRYGAAQRIKLVMPQPH